MNIQICPGKDEHIEGCIQSIKHSVLWDTYFQYLTHLEEMFKDGVRKKQIHVALNPEGRCIGYIWVVKDGGFSHFPYLRSFAVQRRYRNKRIGTTLLQYFEQLLPSQRFFILVSELNNAAMRFYERNGYSAVGEAPDLFRSGICEIILTKHTGLEKEGHPLFHR
jgi:ribosomal protein S18 acetylase RimI-like enzyme